LASRTGLSQGKETWKCLRHSECEGNILALTKEVEQCLRLLECGG